MTDLFTVAPLNDDMRNALADTFTVHHVDDMNDPVVWLDQNGAGIEFVLTDGHFGLCRDYMERLPDLKLISSNGVGRTSLPDRISSSIGVPGTIIKESAPT